MNNQLLLVGDDSFFHSRELHDSYVCIQVGSTDEAIAMADRFDFGAILSQDRTEVLNHVRAQGKHTPYLHISQTAMNSDCCGGHTYPTATHSEKMEAVEGLLKRNHYSDCV